ncbi:MAG: hypothetical protein QW035_02425 [Candidatus Anstonellales archaeon]
MRGITIILEDKLGVLADLSYILGKEKINIETISAHTLGGKAIVYLTVDNYAKACSVLKKNGIEALTEKELVIKLVDKPGSLYEVAKQMKENGINIREVHIVSRDGKETVVSLIVDKVQKAKALLKDKLIYE